MVAGSITSQRILTVVSSKNGSMTAVAASGIRIMSDSLIPFQPAIDEPSNILPSVNRPASTRRAGMETCCSLPRVSVNRRSAYLTSFSFISFSTSVGVIAPPKMGLPDVDRAAGHCSPCANMWHGRINKLELHHSHCALQWGEWKSLRSETGQHAWRRSDSVVPVRQMLGFGAPRAPHDGASTWLYCAPMQFLGSLLFTLFLFVWTFL